MKPARPVYLAGQAITPFIGQGNPAFITRVSGVATIGLTGNMGGNGCTVVAMVLENQN